MLYSDSLEWKLATTLIKQKARYSNYSLSSLKIEVATQSLCKNARRLETQKLLLGDASSEVQRGQIIAQNPFLHLNIVESILNSGSIEDICRLAENTAVVERYSVAPAEQKEFTTSAASKIAELIIGLRNEANIAEETLKCAMTACQEQTVEAL